jgi:hypothetical protein
MRKKVLFKDGRVKQVSEAMAAHLLSIGAIHSKSRSYENYSLTELRAMFPEIKARSQKAFIKQIQ